MDGEMKDCEKKKGPRRSWWWWWWYRFVMGLKVMQLHRWKWIRLWAYDSIFGDAERLRDLRKKWRCEIVLCFSMLKISAAAGHLEFLGNFARLVLIAGSKAANQARRIFAYFHPGHVNVVFERTRNENWISIPDKSRNLRPTSSCMSVDAAVT